MNLPTIKFRRQSPLSSSKSSAGYQKSHQKTAPERQPSDNADSVTASISLRPESTEYTPTEHQTSTKNAMTKPSTL